MTSLRVKFWVPSDIRISHASFSWVPTPKLSTADGRNCREITIGADLVAENATEQAVAQAHDAKFNELL
eukprot:1347054-Amorphochlora_amoeboformis.AAC.1